MRVLLFIVNFFIVTGYVPNIRIYQKIIKKKEITIYEPFNSIPKDSHSVMFFTGGNGLIPYEFYNNFIKSISNENITVFIGPSNVKESAILLEEMVDKYKSATVMGHSTGCVNTVRTANTNKNCTRAILLDPVNNSPFLDIFKMWRLPSFYPFWGVWKKNENLKFKYVDSLLTLKAEKAYKWNISGEKKIPFLLFFGSDGSELINSNKKFILKNFEENGHTDLLNPLWSNFMHNTISPGTKNRNIENLNEYCIKLAKDSAIFIKDA